jgi:hypothetical protein
MELSGYLHAQAIFPRESAFWYQLVRKMNGPHIRSGLYEEEKLVKAIKI